MGGALSGKTVLVTGASAGIGGRDSCVTHRNCADDYGAPSCFPTTIRNAGSSIILTDPMLIAAARSCAANVGARQQTARRARAFSFPDAGRERDGRLPATRLPRFAPSSRRV